MGEMRNCYDLVGKPEGKIFENLGINVRIKWK
jgi:hypothetical protein